MRYVLGFLAGALWGVLGACLNNAVLGRALRGGIPDRVSPQHFCH